jgi:hypothetical protein
LNDTLKLLRRMNLYECYMYLNNDGYDAIYCENVKFYECLNDIDDDGYNVIYYVNVNL